MSGIEDKFSFFFSSFEKLFLPFSNNKSKLSLKSINCNFDMKIFEKSFFIIMFILPYCSKQFKQ